MAITPKPFNEGDKIQKAIYYGNPNIFSAQDLNRHFSALDTSVQNLWKTVGMYRDNWQMSIVSLNETPSGGNTLLSVTVNVSKQNPSKGAFVYAKGVRFNMPLINGLTFSYTGNTARSSAVLYLIAKKKTVTFTDDPIMSGITSSEFPNQLPSSDTVLWSDERIAFGGASSAPSISVDEEIVGIVAMIIRKKSYNVSTGAAEYTRVIRYNAINWLSDIRAKYPTVYDATGESFLYDSNNSILDALLELQAYYETETSKNNYNVGYLLNEDGFNAKLNKPNLFQKRQSLKQAPTFGNIALEIWTPTDTGNLFVSPGGDVIKLIAPMQDGTIIYLRNSGLTPVQVKLGETPVLGQGSTIMSKGIQSILGSSNVMNLLEDEQIGLEQINGTWVIFEYSDWLANYVNSHEASINSFASFPIGGVTAWSGNVSNFDPTGLGTGAWKKWAICNGNNGTPDLRGRFIVGVINGIPNTGAPVLDAEVDPTVPLQGVNPPNYGLGSKGGKPHHKLSAAESGLPEHQHVYLWSPDTSGGNAATAGGGRPLDWEAPNLTTGVVGGPKSALQTHENKPPFYALIWIQRIL